MRQTILHPPQGSLTTNSVILKEHEMRTVNLFLQLGHDIELIPKSNKRGEHTPDIVMLGMSWEIKSPTGQGKYLIANTIQRAVKQSGNLIIDLRRTKRHHDKCLRELRKEFDKSKSIKRLKIITKSSAVIDLMK